MKPLGKNKYEHSCFTMRELIVVIIMLGIMATTVIPKFFTSTGFQEYTYQAEVITKLRSIQLRAMQQTKSNSSECRHTVLVTEKAIGIPESCDLTSGNWQSDTTSVIIESGHDVTFDVSSGNYSFTFDSLGRPSSSCSPCLIEVSGDSTLTIKIESEGYIHEG